VSFKPECVDWATRKFNPTGGGVWSDSELGDRSFESLWECQQIERERFLMERLAREEFRARCARRMAEEKAESNRRRSAPKEAAILEANLKNSKTSMGTALYKAFVQLNKGKRRTQKP
jgi:hypothetical protein